MTPEEIRAEAIDRIAHASYRADYGSKAVAWTELRDITRDRWREMATPLVDALGDLLPTELEIERGLWAQTFDGRKYRLEPDRYQYTIGWRDATDFIGPDLTKDR